YTANGVKTNLDIYFLSGNSIIASSTTDNLATQDPEEFAGVSGTGTFQVVIKEAAGVDPTRLKYVNEGSNGSAATIQFLSNGTTITPHSAATGAMSVGAVPYFNPTTPEFFTSDGPSTILFNSDGTAKSSPEVRQKPDIAAVDGSNTTFFGFDADGDGKNNF